MQETTNETIKRIWDEVLLQIKNEVDINAYNTFYLPLVPVGINGEKFLIEAPTRFVKDVVSSDKFVNILNDCLRNITNTNFIIDVKEKSEINIQFDTQQKNNNDENIKVKSNLNPQFLFDNFVIGPSNRECYEASLAVAIDPGKFYNPLFIYGRAGIGKTHLLHAIGNYCKQNQNRTMNIYYTTANNFVDEFMRSKQNQSIEQMKAKFRSIDILLLDDVQFFAGKDRTNEVFFHLFNDLFNEKKQIVLTSDRNPNDLRGLEDRLVSRFASGLTVGMKAPEFETAKAIILRKILAKNFDIKVDDDAVDFIAQNYSTDVRQIEGAITRLFFYTTTLNKTDDITLDIAIEALKGIASPKNSNSSNISVDDIKKTVCEYYSITESQLVSSSRVKKIADPRSIAIYLCRNLLALTFEQIGHEFGNRDHSTIINACLKMENLVNIDQSYKLAINKIQQLLTGK